MLWEPPVENNTRGSINLSIVIPAHRDPSLSRCIESIDENVEVIVALNDASEDVEQAAVAAGVTIVSMEEAHLGRAYNLGIQAATGDNILLMDSDCIFTSGAIRKLYDGLSNSDLSKGRVQFASKSYLTKIVARVRHIHTVKPNAYSPPLAFKKSILTELGGYYFDPDIPWTEDYDFDMRVRGANLPLTYVDSARIIHPPVNLTRDLRSARNYGMGHAVGYLKGLPWYRLPRLSITQLFKSGRKVFAKYGLATAIYFTVWQISFYFGFRQRLKGTNRLIDSGDSPIRR